MRGRKLHEKQDWSFKGTGKEGSFCVLTMTVTSSFKRALNYCTGSLIGWGHKICHSGRLFVASKYAHQVNIQGSLALFLRSRSSFHASASNVLAVAALPGNNHKLESHPRPSGCLCVTSPELHQRITRLDHFGLPGAAERPESRRCCCLCSSNPVAG